MKQRLTLLIIALLLILTVTPAYWQTADTSSGDTASLSDDFGQPCTITSPTVRVDKDPAWTTASFSFTIAYRVPQIPPTCEESRAPPA